MKAMESLQNARVDDYAGISRCPTVPKTFYTPSFFLEIVGGNSQRRRCRHPAPCYEDCLVDECIAEVDATRADAILLVIAADTPVSTEVFSAALGYAKPLIVLINKMFVLTRASPNNLRFELTVVGTWSIGPKLNSRSPLRRSRLRR